METYRKCVILYYFWCDTSQKQHVLRCTSVDITVSYFRNSHVIRVTNILLWHMLEMRHGILYNFDVTRVVNKTRHSVQMLCDTCHLRHVHTVKILIDTCHSWHLQTVNILLGHVSLSTLVALYKFWSDTCHFRQVPDCTNFDVPRVLFDPCGTVQTMMWHLLFRHVGHCTKFGVDTCRSRHVWYSINVYVIRVNFDTFWKVQMLMWHVSISTRG